MAISHKLAELQLAIMQVLWERGEATVAEVRTAIEPLRQLAHTTIGTMLTKMEAKLDRGNNKKLSDKEKSDRQIYREIIGSIQAIKTAWRNPTMHIERSYTQQQAKVIYDAVGGLMKRLASELEPQELARLSTGPIINTD